MKNIITTSLVTQWLKLCASMRGVHDLIPGRVTNILHAALCGPKKKKRKKLQKNKISGPKFMQLIKGSAHTPNHYTLLLLKE